MRTLLLLACLACALPCFATEPTTGLLGCRALTDSAARLACFDRETAALAANPVPAIAAAATPELGAPPLDALQTFGLNDSAIAAHEEAAGARAQKLAKVEGRIVGLALSGDGRTLFTLDNAQVWLQIDSEGDLLAKLGDSATISRGLLGSYWLQLKSRRGCKVTRAR